MESLKRHINKWTVSQTKMFCRKSESWIDLSNYATKAGLKNAAGVDTSKFVKKKKANLASLKSEVDKLDIEKLEKVPAGLNSLKSKLDNLDVEKLVPLPADLNKQM